ncbi:MAG TPA: DUF6072 family protein [Pyrinomonadaceae bacterium]|jgi:hypothetical protein|nr:DUF6072 family protein [Pyrinomonadaceae bacterium]
MQQEGRVRRKVGARSSKQSRLARANSDDKGDNQMAASDAKNVQPVKTGVQFASEVLIPGGSNLINGDFKTAGIHAAIGLAAGAIFGLPGILLVSANSFTKATTGSSLLTHLNITDGGK